MIIITCENGIYYTYPKDIYDADSTYYDKNGNKLASCYFGGGDPNCEEVRKLAGECTP